MPDLVTGAFSYTGRAIAEVLLERGRQVRTLSRSPAPPGSPVEAFPLSFGPELARALEGVGVLYNTYWIRFPHGASTYERAIANTRALFAAAREAGVRRIVHLSVTNADERSPFPYFRGKAALERELRESGSSHAIVRPTLVFGPNDILINNIAWILRRLPVFLIPGDGSYRVQPVSVDDTAALAVAAGEGDGDTAVDAAGPESYRFDELVSLIARAVGSRARLRSARPAVALALSGLVGRLRHDVLITREELAALMASTLVSAEAPRGRASFAGWVAQHAEHLGRRYVSELARNFRPYAPV